MIIEIEQPVAVPGCPVKSKLVDVSVNGDEATVCVYPDGSWALLRAEGDADLITDWTFVCDAVEVT